MIRFSWYDTFVLIFGTADLNYLIGGFFFSIISFCISIGMRVSKGIKENPNTPERFSLQFYLLNNWLSLVVGYALTLTFLRFSVDITGAEATMWMAWVYGFLNYRLGDILNNRIDAIFEAFNKVTDKVKAFITKHFS